MKKALLTLVTFALVSFGTLNANNNQNLNNSINSFSFIENGITFSVFQNGEFDFYLNNINGVRVNYQINNVSISFNSGYNYNNYVQYDRYGAVIQIMNTPIFYDYYGRISRIGNVNVNYINGRLVALGGMQIFYNNYGRYAYYSGYVNTYNRHYRPQHYNNCFVKPYYDYRTVSHIPYRKHYKANRYAYNNHSNKKNHKNDKAYYSNNNKHIKNQRTKTTNIPKKRNSQVVLNDRKQIHSSNSDRNTNYSNNRSSTKSRSNNSNNSKDYSNNRSSTKNRSNNNTNSRTDTKRTPTSYANNSKNYSNNRSSTKNSSSKNNISRTDAKRTSTSYSSNSKNIRGPLKIEENKRTASVNSRNLENTSSRIERSSDYRKRANY